MADIFGPVAEAARWAADKVGDIVEATGIPGGDVINAALDASGELATGDVGGAWDAAARLFGGGDEPQAGGPGSYPGAVLPPGFSPSAGAPPPPVPAWAEPLGAGAGALAGRAAGAAVGGPTGAAVGQALGAAAGSALAGWLTQPPATIQPVGQPVPWGGSPAAGGSPLDMIQASMGLMSQEQIALLAVVANNWGWIAPNLWRAGIGPRGVWSRKCAPLLGKLSKSERNALAALTCGAPELLSSKAEENAYMVGWAAIQLVLVPQSEMENSLCACKA